LPGRGKALGAERMDEVEKKEMKIEVKEKERKVKNEREKK
jgi:hypothetical protein